MRLYSNTLLIHVVDSSIHFCWNNVLLTCSRNIFSTRMSKIPRISPSHFPRLALWELNVPTAKTCLVWVGFSLDCYNLEVINISFRNFTKMDLVDIWKHFFKKRTGKWIYRRIIACIKTAVLCPNINSLHVNYRAPPPDPQSCVCSVAMPTLAHQIV